MRGLAAVLAVIVVTVGAAAPMVAATPDADRPVAVADIYFRPFPAAYCTSTYNCVSTYNACKYVCNHIKHANTGVHHYTTARE